MSDTPNNTPLTRASLRTHTGDDDRDWNSYISVEARASDGATLIAYAYLAEGQGPNGYGDGEWHEFDLTLNGLVVRPWIWWRCWGFAFRMGITPTGHDNWNFDAWLILHFQDGSFMWSDKMGQRLDVYDPWNHKTPRYQCDWTNSHGTPPSSDVDIIRS